MEHFWSYTRAKTEVPFENAIVALKDASKEAYDWLAEKDKHKWCKSFFRYNINFYDYFTCLNSIIQLLHVF